MPAFERIAPFLTDPLVLVGFSLLLIVGLFRAILSTSGTGMLPRLTKHDGGRVVFTLMRYAFILALLLIVLGFGLKAYDFHEARTAKDGRVTALEGKIDELAEAVKHINVVSGVPLDPSKICMEPKPELWGSFLHVINQTSLSDSEKVKNLQLVRDGLNRACLGYQTGSLSKDEHFNIYARYNSAMVVAFLMEKIPETINNVIRNE